MLSGSILSLRHRVLCRVAVGLSVTEYNNENMWIMRIITVFTVCGLHSSRRCASAAGVELSFVVHRMSMSSRSLRSSVATAEERGVVPYQEIVTQNTTRPYKAFYNVIG